MRRHRWTVTVTIIAVVSGLFAARLSADQTNPPQPPPAQVKVEVIITRLQGETRLGSVPYVLSLGTNNMVTSLRLGVDVPTGAQSTRTAENGVTTSVPGYRNIGTNIDARVAPPKREGQYELYISIEETSIHSARLDTGSEPRPIMPLAFRTYSSSNNLVVNDGELVEFSVGTDKVTGETIRASVRLTAK